MKFPLIHTGRRFFFFTFVVEGRMPVLSRLVRGAKRPALSWSAIGDVTLLASPFLYPVRLSMKRTAEELESEIAEHVERARHGWTPVCGFLSPGERIADMAARAFTSDGGRRPPNPLAPASATGGSGVVATGGSGVSPVVRKEGAR